MAKKKNQPPRKPVKKTRKSKPRGATVQKDGLGLSEAGTALGAYLGGPIGAIAGKLGGSLLSKITGFGEYHVNRNSISEGTIPSFYNDGQGFVVAHREFIGDVDSRTAFTMRHGLAINPGLSATFPWLSNIAVNFEQYEMLGLVFEYRSTSGVISSTQALGYVVMATNYDVNDTPFNSKVAMEAYEFSNSTGPDKGCLHPVECDPRSRPTNVLYVRTGGVPTGSLLNYDLGNFYLATGGQSANGVILGELWITYHVRFLKPKLVEYTDCAHVQNTACAAGSPLGSNATAVTVSNNIAGFSRSGSSTMTFAMVGYYLVSCQWYEAAGAIAAVATMTPGSNISLVASQWISSPTGNGLAANFITTFSTLQFTIFVSNPGSPATPVTNNITIGGCAGMANANLDIWVTYLGNLANV